MYSLERQKGIGSIKYYENTMRVLWDVLYNLYISHLK